MAQHLPPARSDRSDLCVVLVPGFTQSSRSERVRRVADWVHQRAGVVLLDLRGHGRSGGVSTLGWYEVLDVDTAVGWARALGYRRVVTLGFSLGAAVVLRHAAINRGVDAVAAVSGPGQWNYRGSANMRTLHRLVLTAPGRGLLRVVRGTRVSSRRWLPPYPLDPRAAAAEIDVPLLVVHGDRDDYLPVHHAWRIQAAAPNGTLWVEPGFGHAEGAVTEPLAGRIIGWLDDAATRDAIIDADGASMGDTEWPR
jgi:pimeloyl-ACP methyl ester carboxylesterase